MHSYFPSGKVESIIIRKIIRIYARPLDFGDFCLYDLAKERRVVKNNEVLTTEMLKISKNHMRGQMLWQSRH